MKPSRFKPNPSADADMQQAEVNQQKSEEKIPEESKTPQPIVSKNDSEVEKSKIQNEQHPESDDDVSSS